MSEKTLELKPCPFCGEQPSILKNMGTVFCGNDACFGPQTTAERLEDSAVQWNAHASSPAQEPVTTEPVAWLADWLEVYVNVHAPMHDETRFRRCIAALRTIPAPPQPGRDANDKHYLAAIRHHLKRLYSIYPNNARLREQISDEIDWIDATLTGAPK